MPNISNKNFNGCFVFFFQAEDGIRDSPVTGVQTCALPISGAPHFLARQLEAKVINAGDGTHAHPTQSLLDLYTIRKNIGTIEGKKIVIVGDILYSRVARSNLWGLTKMGARVVICGPQTLIPNDFLNGHRKIGRAHV